MIIQDLQEIYLEELQKMIECTKKHKRFLQNLYDEINYYSPCFLSKLRLRNHRTTNIQEGLFGNLKQQTNNEIVSMVELFESVKDLLISGVMNSMSYKPDLLSKEISTSKYIGHLAFEILNTETIKAKKQISTAMTFNLSQQQSFELLNSCCNCKIQHDNGLMCCHEIMHNIKNSIYPVIPGVQYL